MSTIRELIKKWRDDVCDCTSDVHPINHRAVMARLGAIEKAAEALEADRDNWMKQALAEDERANAVCDAASTRNCDIGTFDEQLARFLDYCNGRACSECPLLPKKDRGERYACAIAWMGAKHNGGAK